MDTIKLVVEDDFQKGDEVYLDFNLLINGKPLQEVLGIDKDDVFDLFDFVRSCVEPGECFLAVCTCGKPDCEGFDLPMLIEHTPKEVKLEVAGMFEDKPFAKPLVFTFNKKQYLAIAQEIVQALKEKVALYGKKNPKLVVKWTEYWTAEEFLEELDELLETNG